MYIRLRISRGRTYYEVRTSIWKNGRPIPRSIVQLGIHPTIEAALQFYEQAYFQARKAGTREPFSAEELKAWKRVARLSDLLEKQAGLEYQPSDRIRKEVARWWRWSMRSQAVHDLDPYSRVLGIAPGSRMKRIKAAYRQKARECHPDHGGSDEAMARLNEAYERLTNR
jgi:hypothetical protein